MRRQKGYVPSAGLGKPPRQAGVLLATHAEGRPSCRRTSRTLQGVALPRFKMERNLNNYPGRWWHLLDDGRMQCDLCPRDCKLHEGQRGLCFVRKREGDQMVLATYGR